MPRAPLKFGKMDKLCSDWEKVQLNKDCKGVVIQCTLVKVVPKAEMVGDDWKEEEDEAIVDIDTLAGDQEVEEDLKHSEVGSELHLK
jgi:hypothetical protein